MEQQAYVTAHDISCHCARNEPKSTCLPTWFARDCMQEPDRSPACFREGLVDLGHQRLALAGEMCYRKRIGLTQARVYATELGHVEVVGFKTISQTSVARMLPSRRTWAIVVMW